MSEKSLAEIKIEALNLAKDILDKEYKDSKEISDIVIMQVKMRRDLELKDPEDVKMYLESLAPKMYTTLDVIRRARDFFDWINEDPLNDF